MEPLNIPGCFEASEAQDPKPLRREITHMIIFIVIYFKRSGHGATK